ncbi:MAG: cupredoxin domain-containing protein [Myxococcota bacterium]
MRRLALLIFLLLVGAGGPTEVIVIMTRQGFDPPQVEIDRGTTVEFHRRDPGPGTWRLVSGDGAIESWPFEHLTQWSHRFTRKGTFELFIAEHPETRIRVRVR